MEKVILREITKCNLDQKKEVREVRNLESVRRFMYTDHIIGLAEHFAWIDRLENDKKQIVFVVLLGNKVSGVVSINALDRIHRKSEWAFYLDDKARGGVGAALEYALLNYAFDALGLEKLNCEVIETNPSVVKMHLKFGFLEEGFMRSNIIKNDVRIGVHCLGLLKEDWVVKRAELSLAYKFIFDKFPVTIEAPVFSA
jgi:UDP-4-amino-4,6-dideoxy-N-acetyl-beta-L-altrosamine N-acetyltransferase